MKTFKEFLLAAEGMTMKDFKANRRKLKRREASADAKKRGHVGKEWYNSGRTYSPDEAKRGRANMPDHERSTRHRSSMDPEGDDSNYSADKTKNPKKLRKQRAMGEIAKEEVQQLDELSVNKMLAYKKKAEKNRDELNKKWDKGTATYREKMKVLGHEEGEERASRRIEKKTGKHPYDMNAIDRVRSTFKK